MIKARIYQKAKNAMQSGRAKTKGWWLEWEPAAPQTPDPLMGWNSQKDTTRQVRLHFPSQKEAIEYAKKHGLIYEIAKPHALKFTPKSYAENFSFSRVKA